MSKINENIQLHELFYRVSKVFPNNLAIISYKDKENVMKITYEELRCQSLEISRCVINVENKCSVMHFSIGILCDPGIEAIACMLGILKHGSFMFISPFKPEIELLNLIKNIPLNVIIAKAMYLEKLTKYNPTIIKEFNIFDEKCFLVKLENSTNQEKILMQHSCAYIISTSGSTGSPKVIHVPHKCIVPNILDFKKIFEVTEKDIIMNLSPFTFDPSIIDIFLSLSSGAQLIIIPQTILMKPKFLESVLSKSSISVMQSTPSLLGTLRINFLKKYFKTANFRVLALGGEQFPSKEKCREWFGLDCNIQIFNLYGLTEISCWASYHKVDLKAYISSSITNEISSVPIGKPLTGTKIYLLDNSGNLVTTGKGKIVLDGERNICYIDNSKINFGEAIETGDVGYGHGADIYFVERIDNIIKRNSCKIELSEIESISKLLPGIFESAAVFYDNKICLFIVLHSCTNISKIMIKDHFVKHLSTWKLPDEIYFLESLPLNSSLKVNKLKLVIEAQKLFQHIIDEIPEGPVTKDIFEKLCELLNQYIPNYTPNQNENFINLGGNSVQAVHFCSILENKFNVKSPILLDTLLNGTLGEIYNLLKKSSSYSSDSSLINSLFNTNRFNTEKEKFVDHTSEPSSNVIYLNGIKNTSRRGTYMNGEKISTIINNKREFKISWKVSLGKCIDASPLIIELKNKPKIYIGSHSHCLMCLSEKGDILWSKKLNDRIEASAASSIDGKSIYIGCYDGNLYCINADDGEEVWKIPTKGYVKSSVIIDRQTGNLIFGSYDKHLYCCDKFGIIIWTKQLSSGSIYSTPVIIDNLIVVATLDGFLTCLNAKDGNFIWKIFIGKPIFSSLTKFSLGILFGCTDNSIYCVKKDSKILWKYETNGPIFSSPFLIEKENIMLIGVGSHDHCLYLLDGRGVEIFKFQLSSPIFSTPFIASDWRKNFHIYISESSGKIHLFSLQYENGSWKSFNHNETIKLSGEIFSSPIICNNNLYVGCRDNYLYCIEI